MTEQYGWHFLPDNGRLSHGDGRKAEVGVMLTVEPPLKLCDHGLHWCRRAIDALHNGIGALACYVRAGGETLERADQCCSTERTVIAMADATALLHEFACWCAEGALRTAGITDRRSWAAIETKRRWLRGEATDAELYAARNAAGFSAGDVAWAAVGATARTAASEAAQAAARVAAWDAAGVAAWDAAGVAAWDAAGVAAWDAARAAARIAQSVELEQRLRALLVLGDAEGPEVTP